MAETEDRIECFRATLVLGRLTRYVDGLVTDVNLDRVRSGGPNGNRERAVRNSLRRASADLAKTVQEVGRYCGVDGEMRTAAGEMIAAFGPPVINLDLAFRASSHFQLAMERPTLARPSEARDILPGPPGEPPLVVLTNEGYVTVRGPKHDVTLFQRVTDGDIQFAIYPPGAAPPSGSDMEVGDLHAAAEESTSLDGGEWFTRTEGEVRGAEDEIHEITGTRVRLVTTIKPGESIEERMGIVPVGHEEPPEDTDDDAGSRQTS